MRSSPEAFPLSVDAYELGEGPRLDPRTGELLWVDIRAGRLLRGRLSGRRLTVVAAHPVGEPVGAVAPAAAADGGWVVAAGRGFAHVSATGAVAPLTGAVAAAGTQMNDGGVDPYGRFLAGSQVVGGGAAWSGGLYRLDPDGTAHTVLTGVGCANGLGFSPSGDVLYHVDSRRKELAAYRYHESGGAGDRRVLVSFTSATPDGLCVDAEGCLWVAMWDGWSVLRLAPDGSLLTRVSLPVPRPTATCLVDGTLVVTSAWLGLDDPPPDSGRLFGVEVGVAAAAAHSWNGVA